MVLHWEIQWLTTVITMYGKIFRKLRLQGPHGKEAPYKDLPFSPCIIASTKIAEGDYGDCLKMLMTDIEEEKKYKGLRGYSVDYTAAKTYKSDRPVVYLAGPERYDKDAKELYKKRKELCASYGLQAFTPADWAEGVEKMDTDCIDYGATEAGVVILLIPCAILFLALQKYYVKGFIYSWSLKRERACM